jgi:hypothetical protein
MKRNGKLLVTIGLTAVGLAAVLSAVEMSSGDEGPMKDEYIQVEVRGLLNTGVVAIGGETTGVTITARGVTWELDLGNDEALRKAAEKLDGRRVDVTGALEVRDGVEIAKRWIVSVKTLEAASKE